MGGAAAAGSFAADGANAAPEDLPKNLRPAAADSASLYPEIERLANAREFSHSFLSGRFRSVDEYRTEGRRVVLEAFGYAPPSQAPRPEVIARHAGREFIREKVLFSTTPHFRVPAYVHIPKNRKGRLPAIVDLHSHGGMFLFGKEKVIDFGANHPTMVEYHKRNYGGRPTATELARRGYVVITIDAFPFGERRLIMDEDIKYGWERSKYSVEDVKHLNDKCRRKESTLVKSLIYAGMTWPGIVAWDDMRTVDYLVTRPEVDPKRIGIVGHSYGGMPISVAAELVPEGVIQSIMYLDAFLPEDGESLNDLVPGEPHLPPDPEDYLVPPPRANLVGFNAHMDAAARAAYEDRRAPQSVFCFNEKARLTGARERVPLKTYVLATGYPNDTFRPVVEKLRQRAGWRVEEMPYTHDLMHVAPVETADMIESALP